MHGSKGDPLASFPVCFILNRGFPFMTKTSYLRGLMAGIPIALGYLSVSFTFGIMAVSVGLYPWQALLISMTTLTSAGQLAGVQMMVPGGYLPMLLTQLTINVRYSFMSVSLAHKADKRFSGIFRWLLAFFMTDEIFAVSAQEPSVRRSFFFGTATLPYFAWALGTLSGALLGSILPASLMDALSIAIYAMFVAIVAPSAVSERPLLAVVGVAALLSLLFTYLPFLSAVPAGLAVSISAIAAATLGAILFPIGEDKGEASI